MKYFCYTRKSQDDKRRQVISIQSQIAETGKLAAQRNITIVETFIEERTAKIPGRPIFNEMLERIRAGEADGILCWKGDRLSRNPVDSATLIELLDQGKVEEIITCDKTYRRHSMDKFMLYLEFALADQYITKLSEDVTRGNRTMLESGLWPGRPPAGYIRDPRYRDDQRFKECIPDPDQRFDQIGQMWRLALSGIPAMEIRRIANDEWGFTLPKYRSAGGGPMSRNQIFQIFHNPFYAGVLVRGGEVYQGKHVSMVTADEFQRVQELLAGRVQPRQSEQRATFPYRGLARCGLCQRAVTSKVTTNRYGTKYKHYYCFRKTWDGYPCSGASTQEKDLDMALSAYFQGIKRPERWWQQAFAKLRELEGAAVLADVKAAEMRRTRAAAIEKELDRLRCLVVDGTFSKEEYENAKQRLVLEKLDLDQRSDTVAPKLLEPLEEALSWLGSAKNVFTSGTEDQKADVARHVLLELKIDEKKVLVQAKKPLAALRGRLKSPLLWTREYVLETFL